jgi:hypothetical protein
MHPAITYTLLTLLAGAFAGGWWLDGRPDGHTLARYRKFSLVAQVGALLGAFLLLRPGESPHARPDTFEAAVGHGTPALIDMYSTS